MIKLTIHPNFDLVRELKNLCIKMSLLQVIRDVPIYAKMIKYLSSKNIGSKLKDPPTTHVVGTFQTSS